MNTSKLKFEDFLNKDFIYAVVGATENKEKYGYKVFSSLKKKGYKVVPINHKYESIDGCPCFPDLLSLDERPDVVVLVVGEENAKKVVQNCVDSDLNKIWFQPGSEYIEAVKIAKDSGIDMVIGKCIMKES